MTILINQTLHGYSEGHQLLSASSTLTSEEKKILLFQSDLSGSNITDEFKVYITGYPIKISNIYAFSRSWYAEEMSRPGCVWTHTLLIGFADIGKIPDFNLLLELFLRPRVDEYSFYSKSIKVNIDSKPQNKFWQPNTLSRKILKGLYNNPDKAILLPIEDPKAIETEILTIWSHQWPRLRRNFTFCSGALSARFLEAKDFDFQVMPPKNVSSIERQANKPLNLENFNEGNDQWISVYQKYPIRRILNFFWKYGSDIGGERKNFKTLVQLFEMVQSGKSLSEVFQCANEFFPSSSEGRHFKFRLISEPSLISPTFSDYDTLQFLIFNKGLDDINDLDELISEKLLAVINSGGISINEAFSLVKKGNKVDIFLRVWDKIEIQSFDITRLSEYPPELLVLIFKRKPSLLESIELWQTDYSFQKEVLLNVIEQLDLQWQQKGVFNILSAKSTVIFEAKNKLGERVVYWSLDWLNYHSPTPQMLPEWEKEVARNSSIISSWLSRVGIANDPIYIMIVYNMEVQKIQSLPIGAETWILFYEKSKKKIIPSNVVYISSLILSIGFKNRIRNAEQLVSVTFHDVYSLAASSKIDYKLWEYIPKDLEVEEEEFDLINVLKAFTAYMFKKKDTIEAWDYCEILIRTLCNLTIKNGWSTVSFVQALKNPSAFHRAAAYCLTFKKGRKLLKKVAQNINDKKVKAFEFQLQALKDLPQSIFKI